MNSPRVSSALVAFGLFIIDRLLKQLAMINSSAADIFLIDTTLNSLGPFSWYLPELMLWPLAVLALFWLVHLALKAGTQGNARQLLGIWLMLAGGYSNLADRLVRGGVVDIWHLAIGRGLNFNLADILLLCGLVLLIIRENRTAAKQSSA